MGSVILLFLLCSLAPFLAAADVFCDNVKLLAATLPNNTSSSPVHFATATVGKAPDAVYALAYCPSDVVNSIDCSKCVARTFARVFNATPPPQQQCYKNVSVYGPDPCILLYSDEDILSTYNTSAAQNGKDMLFERWNVRNVTGDIFLISGLIRELMAATMKKAASMALRRFATGVMDSGTTFPLVYSMAQCKPDLSAGDCLACLRDLLGTVSSTMSLRIGGQVYVIRCNFRYEASQFYDGKPMLQLGPHSAPAPASTVTNKRRVSKLWAIPLALVPLAAAAFLCFRFYSRRLKGSRHVRHLERVEQLVWQWKNSEFSVFDFHQVQEATNNFSEEMKLGQGGFGAVYKGQFPEGLEIAVKRLASHSGQGFLEFKNEVQLIAKLQHTNLVRLLGCCSQQEEKILVYEYLPNKSLDFFIFDKNKRSLLDWSKLVAIIEGIARGLLYLHKHSRLRVIHRDLKPGNILLDNEMNPKISDFGLTKIFDSDNTEANSTRRVVGTYGYMAPEYASEGIFSIKSDVFSFGVVVLEILSGKRNSGVEQCGDLTNLLEYAWQLWEEERWIDLVDATLVPESHSVEMMRCINIALLCVQESAADRPTMSDIVAMLTSENIIMAQPKQPAYFRNEGEFTPPKLCSINEMTISILTPRCEFRLEELE